MRGNHCWYIVLALARKDSRPKPHISSRIDVNGNTVLDMHHDQSGDSASLWRCVFELRLRHF
jgi:hypothetical protein